MSVDPETISSGGFATLPGAIDPGKAQQPLTTEETKTASEQWSDEAAVRVVLTDVQATIAYLNSKGLVPLGIEMADDLIRAYSRPKQWADGKPRANLSMHVTLQAIEKILPALYLSLFGNGKKKPFVITPVGKTKPEAARANSSLLWWAFKQAKCKEEFRIALKTALTYGLVIGEWGWESKERRAKEYKKQADGTMKGTFKNEDVELPFFEVSDLKMIGLDPLLKRQDCRKGRFVWKQVYTNGYGLADLRKNPDYQNIPSDNDLRFFLATKSEPTADTLASDKRAVWREFQSQLEIEWAGGDPMLQPLEILHYVTEDRRIALLQRKLVIQNKENEFGEINFTSCSFIDVLGSAWGFGIAKLLGGEQRLQQGVVNNWIDSLALVLNPVFQLLKGIGPGTQSIPLSPGKVLNMAGELKPLVVPDVTAPAMEALTTSDARAMEKVAANGGTNMPTQAMRTAQGVQAFASDIIQRLQYFLEIFADLVYVPTLEAFLRMMKDHLTPEQVNSILTEEEGKAYEGDISDVYNAKCNVDILAGANMMAKFAAAQLAPLIIQLVSAGPVADQFEVAGKKFEYAEFITETLDMMGWDVENLISDMTAADLQRVQQKNAAMIQAQGKMMLQNQKHQDDLESIDAKASGQAGVAVVRSALKNNMESGEQVMESLSGNGNGNGQ